MIELTAFVVLAKVIVLAFGIVIVHVSYRAYKRTESPPLRSLTIAFGVITIGTLLGGGLDQLIGLDLELGVFVNSLLTAIGYGVLARSLYQTEGRIPAADSNID